MTHCGSWLGDAPGRAGAENRGVATLFLMVGLPGAGKTTRAKELAAEHGALQLSPDGRMIPLFGESDAGGKRDVLEGRAHIAGPGSGETGDWAAARWPSLADD